MKCIDSNPNRRKTTVAELIFDHVAVVENIADDDWMKSSGLIHVFVLGLPLCLPVSFIVKGAALRAAYCDRRNKVRCHGGEGRDGGGLRSGGVFLEAKFRYRNQCTAGCWSAQERLSLEEVNDRVII